MEGRDRECASYPIFIFRLSHEKRQLRLPKYAPCPNNCIYIRKFSKQLFVSACFAHQGSFRSRRRRRRGFGTHAWQELYNLFKLNTRFLGNESVHATLLGYSGKIKNLFQKKKKSFPSSSPFLSRQTFSICFFPSFPLR